MFTVLHIFGLLSHKSNLLFVLNKHITADCFSFIIPSFIYYILKVSRWKKKSHTAFLLCWLFGQKQYHKCRLQSTSAKNILQGAWWHNYWGLSQLCFGIHLCIIGIQYYSISRLGGKFHPRYLPVAFAGIYRSGKYSSSGKYWQILANWNFFGLKKTAEVFKQVALK